MSERNRPGSSKLASYQPTPGNLRQTQPDFPPPRSSPQVEQPAEGSGRRVRSLGATVYATARTVATLSNFLRLLGVALIVYGAIGLAASLYGYSLVRQAFASAREIGVLAPGEKGNALRSLESIATTLDDASKTSANLTSSFKESQTSLKTASEVATDVAASFRQVAQVASFQLFGIQPMAGMAQPFLESSDRLDTLSQDLTRTSGAIGANATDMQRLSADFNRLKVEVDGLAQTVSRLPTDPTSGEGARRLETALSAMLIWIALQGVGSIALGLALLLIPFMKRARTFQAGQASPDYTM